MQKIDVKWNQEMSFKTEVNGHEILIDADEKVGGQNLGPRPKPLLLVALGGCTGMDVVSMLKKMRVNFSDFNISIEGEMTDEHPKYYKTLHVKYEFWGQDLPIEKLEKAVNLSQERYCGVSAMLGKASEITHEIIIH